ncbi:MAG: PASTA domain-containing protein, partial [Solirubrobacteraceae bacterium]
QTTSTQSPGTVLSQSPVTGTAVRAESNVNLVVAQAPNEASVPDVQGETIALARSELTQAGFKVRTAHAPTSEASAVGTVLHQSPTPGSRAPKGSTVTVSVGQAAPPTTPTTTTGTTPATPPAATPGA